MCACVCRSVDSRVSQILRLKASDARDDAAPSWSLDRVPMSQGLCRTTAPPLPTCHFLPREGRGGREWDCVSGDGYGGRHARRQL